MLTVVDDDGASASDTTLVTVVSVNAPPTVSAGPDQSVTELSLVTLTGSASDSDGQVASLTWRQASGYPVQLSNANQASASFFAPATAMPLVLVFTLTATDNEGASGSDAVTVTVTSTRVLGAGFRFSTLGPAANAGAQYWANVGAQISGKFPGSQPQALWVVSLAQGSGTVLTFPGSSADPLIAFQPEDANEDALDLLDASGVRVWLQLEPGDASVETLIDLVLARYGHHPSVVGVGVDVEWYRWSANPEGKAVADAEAGNWLARVRAKNPGYELSLTHWETAKMPPTLRDGILFIDDSQDFTSLSHMTQEFSAWGAAFAPGPVAFLYGFASDRSLWGGLADPVGDVGRMILDNVPNTKGLFWVDATILEVFPSGE